MSHLVNLPNDTFYEQNIRISRRTNRHNSDSLKSPQKSPMYKPMYTRKYKLPTTTITYGSKSSLPAMMVRGAIPMSRWTVIAPDRVGALTGTLTGIVRPAGGLAMPRRPARRDLTDLGVTESLVRHVLRVCR